MSSLYHFIRSWILCLSMAEHFVSFERSVRSAIPQLNRTQKEIRLWIQKTWQMASSHECSPFESLDEPEKKKGLAWMTRH
jgi:hypothetical protein